MGSTDSIWTGNILPRGEVDHRASYASTISFYYGSISIELVLIPQKEFRNSRSRPERSFWQRKRELAALVGCVSLAKENTNELWRKLGLQTIQENTIQHSKQVPRLAKSLNFINVMAYDLRGQWDRKTGHHAPLFEKPSDGQAFKDLNVVGVGWHYFDSIIY